MRNSHRRSHEIRSASYGDDWQGTHPSNATVPTGPTMVCFCSRRKHDNGLGVSGGTGAFPRRAGGQAPLTVGAWPCTCPLPPCCAQP